MVLETALEELTATFGEGGTARRIGIAREGVNQWRTGKQRPCGPSAAAVEMAWLLFCRPDLIPDWMERTGGPGPRAWVAARAKKAAYDRRRKEQRRAAALVAPKLK